LRPTRRSSTSRPRLSSVERLAFPIVSNSAFAPDTLSVMRVMRVMRVGALIIEVMVLPDGCGRTTKTIGRSW
jgi:hypothetical protein